MATGGKYFFRPYAWAFQKHSPYLDIFNFYIKEFKEKGTFRQIEKKYEPTPQVCPDLSGKPIEFPNCFTAFLGLFGTCIPELFIAQITKPLVVAFQPELLREL